MDILKQLMKVFNDYYPETVVKGLFYAALRCSYNNKTKQNGKNSITEELCMCSTRILLSLLSFLICACTSCRVLLQRSVGIQRLVGDNSADGRRSYEEEAHLSSE